MDNGERLAFVVILITVLLLVMFVFVGLLMVVNTNRRHRHRADMAEADLRRKQEVMHAEQEATQHTLRDVGRELHDNIAQVLSVVQMGLNNVLIGPNPDPRLVATRDALDQGVEEVRRLAHSLNTDLWQRRSLTDAIGAEAERLERVGRLHAHVVVRRSAPPVAPDTSTILYRVFQEVVHNAVKHSGADTLTITLDDHNGLTLTVADNGRGFDPATTNGDSGLKSIRKRCALVGYKARCTSAPGQGCSWHIQPLPTHGA